VALPDIQKAVMRVPRTEGGFNVSLGFGAVASVPRQTTFDAVEFDCVEKETHQLQNKLTDYPVEQGANITDHSRPEPRRVTLDIIQTNTPLAGSDGADRARDLWKILVDLWRSPKIIELDTARDFYKSMAVESVSALVDAKTSQALVCTVTFKEIIVAQSRFAQVVPTAKPKGQRKKDLGKETSEVIKIGRVGEKALNALGIATE
jgi:hypothetical protein